jgi:hypothetical protein
LLAAGEILAGVHRAASDEDDCGNVVGPKVLSDEVAQGAPRTQDDVVDLGRRRVRQFVEGDHEQTPFVGRVDGDVGLDVAERRFRAAIAEPDEREGGDWAGNAVLENLELVLRQVLDRLAPAVQDDDVERHHIDG